MSHRLTAGLVLGAGLTVSLALTPASAGQEGTVEGFSSWEARGQIFPTGPAEATFVGVLSGVLYVTGEDGEVDAGLITCPSSLVIQTGDGSEVGHGKCVIVTPDSERIFGEFNCTGTYGEGCNGDFRLTGGTGEKAGISGGGPIRIRSAMASLAVIPGNIVEQSAIGVAIWPKLTYKLP